MQCSNKEKQLKWAPLHMHSSYSLLDGFSDIKDLVTYCKEQGYEAAALTDHGVLSGCPALADECKKAGIKPILGCELYVCEGDVEDRSATNRGLSHLVVLCKNLAGWYELVQLVSESNKKEKMYYKPRVDFASMKKYLGNGNHIAISGHPGSTLADVILPNESYDVSSVEEARALLSPDWKQVTIDRIEKHIDIFGRDNFFCEIQLIDKDRLHMTVVLAECLREIVAESKGRYRPVATADSHYVRRSDAIYQRYILCSSLKLTMPEVAYKLRTGGKLPLAGFFMSDNYHIPTQDELFPLHTEEEMQNAILISGMCENYSILSGPKFPKFDCPNTKTEKEYFREICEEGFYNFVVMRGLDVAKYRERFEEEFKVIEEAQLFGYFLIVWDIINFIRKLKKMTPYGRGSAAGCLVSYLSGIVGIDPIRHDLLFERFYNAARAGSLPDIDIDVPSSVRDEVIEYIKQKYGEEHVCQMATFGSLMGRSAMKEVARIENVLSFAEVNEITENIPDKAEIEDELQEMDDKSIIRWALINRPKKFAKWCQIDDNGDLSGPYADMFQKAIALENTYKSQGKHAAGVIISQEIIEDVCPIVRDKEDRAVAAFSMKPLESLGHVKFDILGVAIMDKIGDTIPYLPVGKTIEDMEDSAVWDLFAEGDMKGVFQLELQKRWAKKLKPKNIDHLSALVAIIRPGVVEAIEDGKSMTEHYIDRMNGVDPVPSIHEAIDPVLAPTYGVMIYQEQAMKLASIVAGFTLQEADNLRKAIGKKDVKLMAKVKTEFLEGAKKTQSVPYELAEKIFDWIEKSQRYSFNASHSYSYAYYAYASAYCKVHAPLRYYEVCLNYAKSKPDTSKEMRELINNAKLRNIEVLGPSLENFHHSFTMNVDKNQIYFGVSNIKDVGAQADKLIEMRDHIGIDKFKQSTWMDVLVQTDAHGINKKAMSGLIKCGAFNGPNNKTYRNQMLHEYEHYKELTAKESAYIANNYDKEETLLHNFNKLIQNHKIGATRLQKVAFFRDLIEKPSSSVADSEHSIYNDETQYMGIAITDYIDFTDTNHSLADTNLIDVIAGNAKGTVTVLVKVISRKEITIKKEGKNFGKKMCFLTVEDITSEFNSVTCFPEAYDKYKHLFIEGNTVVVTGDIQVRPDGPSLIVDRVLQG